MNWFAHHSATRNRALPGSIFYKKIPGIAVPGIKA